MTTVLSNSTLYQPRGAAVEDFRINIDDERDATVARLGMRYGKGMHRYHLHARVRYSDDDSEGHRVTIRRLLDDEVIKTLETDWTTTTPDDEYGITQALHTTYVQSPNEWYEFARAAELPGEKR